jgi:hypothetical protein
LCRYWWRYYAVTDVNTNDIYDAVTVVTGVDTDGVYDADAIVDIGGEVNNDTYDYVVTCVDTNGVYDVVTCVNDEDAIVDVDGVTDAAVDADDVIMLLLM